MQVFSFPVGRGQTAQTAEAMRRRTPIPLWTETLVKMIPRFPVQNGHEAVVSVCLKRQIVANALGNQGACSDRTSFYLHLLRILPLDFDRLPPLARVCALGQGSCYFVRNGHHHDGKNCGTHDPPELIAQPGGLAFAAPRKRLMANRAT